MKYTIVLFSLLILCSCKKDNELMPCDIASQQPVDFPLGSGSYWVYNQYRVSEQDTIFLSIDTLSVIGEESFDGEVYTQFSSLVPFPQYLIKSENQLNTPHNLWAEFQIGDSIFLSADTTFVGNQPFVSAFGYMSSQQATVNVPAGTFNCFHRLAEYMAFDPDYPHGTRTDNYFIADGIGVVKFNYFYYSSPDDFYYELVDYHIE